MGVLPSALNHEHSESELQSSSLRNREQLMAVLTFAAFALFADTSAATEVAPQV